MAGVHCPHCRRPNEVTGPVATELEFRCAHCGTVSALEIFPTFGRGLEAGRTGARSTADEATCFFHTDKRAEAACDECGRYVCALCEIRVGKRHLCPGCFSGTARGPGGASPTERHRVIRGRLALWIAVGSFFLGPLCLLGGPLAVYFAIRGLRGPGSVTGRRAVAAAVLAMVFGVAGFLFWAAFFAAFFVNLGKLDR